MPQRGNPGTLAPKTPMRIPTLLSIAIASLLAACGNGMPNNTDGGADAGPPCTDCNDALNLHCTSAAGDEAASACSARLQAMNMGATFFIGDRRQCYPNPNKPECRPLCELSSMSFMNMGNLENPSYCGFDTTMFPGCKVNFGMGAGYAVVVQMPNGRRAISGVGNAGNCSGPMGSQRRWGLVGFEDLRTAATCAMATPEGGFDDPGFVACDSNPAACTGTNTCQERMFRAGMTTYARSFCSRMCTGDAECGSTGRCVMGDCFQRCGGPCGLSCPDSFTCSDDTCLPSPQ